MFVSFAQKVFGTANDRIVRRFYRQVEHINSLEKDVATLSDDALRGSTAVYRKWLADGRPLDDILPNAFATVREAAKRTLNMRPFDVQLVGGMVLHAGMIAEMRTGEGKTLVATLPAYLNALTGKGVHIVTVNDYLARRDADWMGNIFRFLDMTVGCIVHGLDDQQRKQEYLADITYATNNELGFDYLRDNMKFSLPQMALRELNFAIVDEVDSILIDEARTPLIISGPAEQSSELYLKLDAIVRQMDADTYEIEEKHKNLIMTETGQERLEEMLRAHHMIENGGLYDIPNMHLLHHCQQALKAHHLFVRDKDYIVKDNKVVIIDEFTGRMMEGRRYSDGLHQALEAKEHVRIQMENQTLASITFQNYFRLYGKLAGMTGTAMTEAAEFEEIYRLSVVDIPTNVSVKRLDENDEIYRTGAEKNTALIQQIEECHARKQPVLVGTVSIAKSEMLAAELKKKKIKHEVLNARYHDQEAMIIAQAGKPGAVTIATNMAGRGTDIQLGGNLELLLRQAGDAETVRRQHAEDRQSVINAGGLYVIGTERHESRRIDNQLRGRSGRQGDPGHSKFYICLEDDLMRIFGSERIDGLLQKLGLQENEAITHPWLNKSIEKAQKKVEQRNFEIRKNLLKFDNVMNDQRTVIYDQRKEIMKSEDVSEIIDDFRHDVIEALTGQHIPPRSDPADWELDALRERIKGIFNLDLDIIRWGNEDGLNDEEIKAKLLDAADGQMQEKRGRYPTPLLRMAEKSLLLQLLDQVWKEHLLALDHLRQGINWRSYGQKDPLNEYKREAFDYFQNMMAHLRELVTTYMARMEMHLGDHAQTGFFQPRATHGAMIESREAILEPDSAQDASTMQAPGMQGMTTPRHTRHAADRIDPNDPDTWGRVPRNGPCPCGSSKKYKHCHGKFHSQLNT